MTVLNWGNAFWKMGSGEKILLVKFEGKDCRARVVIPAAGGAFVLDLASATGLDAALREQRFSVVVADVRAHAGDMVRLIKKLREHQSKAHVFLLSDKIELDQVVSAMRLGVADIFQEPVDFDTVHRAAQGGVAQPAHLRRGDVTAFFAAADAAGAPAGSEPAPSAGELDQLKAELESRTAETAALRAELEAAQATVKNLENEVAKFSVDADASHELEQQHLTVTQELESLRQEKKQWEKTEQARAALDKKVAEPEATASFQKTRTAAERDVQEWQEKQAELETGHALSQQQCKSLDKELAASRQAAEEAKDGLAKLQTEARELEMKLAAETKGRTELAAALKTAQEDLVAKEGESAKHAAALPALQKELEAARARVATLNEAIAKLENEAVAAEVQMTTEAAEVEKLRGELTRERDALAAAREAFAAEKSARDEQLSKRELEIVGRERAHKEAVAQIAEKRKTLEAEQKVAAQAADEGRKILDQAEKQRTELDAARKAMVEKEAACKELEKKLAAEEKRLNGEIATINNDRMSLEAERAAFDQESAALTEQIQAFEKKRVEMKRLLSAQ